MLLDNMNNPPYLAENFVLVEGRKEVKLKKRKAPEEETKEIK